MSCSPLDRCVLLFVASLLAVVGCGGSKYDLAKVTGKVTIDGVPYTGKVLFYPARKGEEIVAGRPSYGLPDADGRFTLNCVKPGDGAMVGEHTVTLFVAKDHAEAYPALRALEFNRVPYPLGKVTVSADEPNDIELAFTSEQIRRYGTMR